jgi:predicted pyridoxine 5'-phosphate oxidase superfamily flavin-nucleotide-binding protein
MKLTAEVKEYINRSVLCWLATASLNHTPNVSPKEVFDSYDDDKIIIANIASPQTVRNIRENPKVCVSFIDIFVQKGFQVKGLAEIVGKGDRNFKPMEEVLMKMTEGKYPFATITCILVEQIKPIIAPKYVLYPDTTEEEQMASARRVYGL